jgi:hypothetical protein
MPRTHPPYAPEYRRRVIGLARAGRRHSSRRLDQRSCEQPRNERHRPARRCKLIISAARRLAVQRWTSSCGSRLPFATKAERPLRLA